MVNIEDMKTTEIIKELERKEKLEQAYNLFMDYWDTFDNEQKKEIDSELKELGL